MHLIAHPAFQPVRVHVVAARVVSLDAHWCVLRWRIEGAANVVVPRFAGKGRQDGLWQTTCFEMFVSGGVDVDAAHNSASDDHPAPTLSPKGRGFGYSEFNFAPSERWAAYDFTAYRAGMAQRPVTRDPVITPRRGGDVLICDVAIPTDALPPPPWRYGLAAVLEEEGGVKSYWAIAHAREQPDFHDPACLGAWLAAPKGA